MVSTVEELSILTICTFSILLILILIFYLLSKIQEHDHVRREITLIVQNRQPDPNCQPFVRNQPEGLDQPMGCDQPIAVRHASGESTQPRKRRSAETPSSSSVSDQSIAQKKSLAAPNKPEMPGTERDGRIKVEPEERPGRKL